MNHTSVATRSAPRAGDWVQVRSKEEILASLDVDGRLEGMPFMPEMLPFCGRRFRVGKRAHKTCDPVNGLQSRRLTKTVHLEGLRCDGSAHGGCQAGCLLFWKDAWLEPVGGRDASVMPPVATAPAIVANSCTEAALSSATMSDHGSHESQAPIYRCQATQVAAATKPLPWWDVRQYIEDYRSGNASLWQMASALVFWTYHNLCNSGIGLGAAMRWTYDLFQRAVGGAPYPWRMGKIPLGETTPTLKLDIREGDIVRVRSYREILGTLNEEWKNRGLYFDGEMVPYTGGTFKVLKRVNRIIHEKTGEMLHFKNECLILDEVVCQARYAKCRKLCPRAYYLYWRDIWVEKVAQGATQSGVGR